MPQNQNGTERPSSPASSCSDSLRWLRHAIRPPTDTAVWPQYGHDLLRRFVPLILCGRTLSAEQRREGNYWPTHALTMVGDARLDAIAADVPQLIDVPGVVMECGVWRGGCLAWMRAQCDASGQRNRIIYGFDTFNGFADDRQTSAKDRPTSLRGFVTESVFHFAPGALTYLRVSEAEVRANLRCFKLSHQIELIAGFVQETLPSSGIEEVAFARIDVDVYEPVRACIEYIWPRLSMGGIIHVDDYGVCPGCRRAVDEYFRGRVSLQKIDYSAVKIIKP